ncbi:putative elongation factor Tu, mitochondrial-like [Capsicum annuum]|nr:putative elongation factor Tu, mitochondrial-like [Capsicum annuum]
MGKNQITIKDTTQSSGVCEKIFKVVNITPGFRSFHRVSPHKNPKFATNSAKATMSKPVALTQNGFTIPLELNRQQIPSQENMVIVEYNHISGDSAIPKFIKGESVNKSSQVKNMFNIVHHDHEINEGSPKDDNDKFSNYIDQVKNKMRSMSSFDDDKVSHRYAIDRSKFNTN